MAYLRRPPIIPDNEAVMSRQYNLPIFFGKLKKVVEAYCEFDMAKIIPVTVACPDESQGLKTLYFTSAFRMCPFVGGKLGAEIDTKGIAPASHHAQNLVYMMGSHTGYDRHTKTWGRLYREKEGGFSTCCGKLAGVMSPYLKEYEYAKNSIKLFKEEGRVLIEIPNRFLGIHGTDDPCAIRLCLEPSLIKGNRESEGFMATESSHSLVFEIHPDLHRALAAKKRTITNDPTPIGDDLTQDYFKFCWLSSDPFPDDITRRLHPLMHQIVSNPESPPIVTIANVNTWIEFNRFVDAMHGIPDVASTGVFGVSGLTVDLYFEDRPYHYSNVYYPQYAFFKRAGEKAGTIMGPSEVHNLLASYASPKEVLSIDWIFGCNDRANDEIKL